MNHKQRFLTPEEWTQYEDVIADMRALTEGFSPNEICAKPFVSPQLVNPSVMIIGYNPGAKGKKAYVWKDSHEPADYEWFYDELKNPKDKFLKLFQRCFKKEDWCELVQDQPVDLVWTNLYPFHTPKINGLAGLFEKIRERHPESHSPKICRDTLARLVINLLHPNIVICAGKNVVKELSKGFVDIGIVPNSIPSPIPLVKGVSYVQFDGIHIIGFSRITSIGFYYDHLNHNNHQQTCTALSFKSKISAKFPYPAPWELGKS